MIRRIKNYRQLMPTAQLSSSALAKHWAKCDGPFGNLPEPVLHVLEPKNWRERLAASYAEDNVFLTDPRPWDKRPSSVQLEIVKLLKHKP